MKKVSILDIAEDLIDEDLYGGIKKNETTVSKDFGSKKSKSTKCSSLEGLITDLAKILEMPVEDLTDWINESAVPEGVAKIILKTARRLKLNPLLGQIAWEINAGGFYEIYIPIDGWIAMIHREPSFQGVEFNQSEDTENGVPIWMECTMYRANLTYPVTVREYYAELKTEYPVWQQIPCRMLRHKTLQQCAKLAFGITIPVLRASSIQKTMQKTKITKSGQEKLNHKELLKQKVAENQCEL